MQTVLFFNELLYLLLVLFLVRLRTRAVHCGSLTTIEHTKLQTRRIDRQPHDATERIDLANDLSFADATDRRIATHLANRIEVRREQNGLSAEPRSSHRSLGPRVTGTYHDDVVVVSN